MTDTKRAILLIEYDDGSRTAYEFSTVERATLNHAGLPGYAALHLTGQCDAYRQFATDEPQRDVAGEFINGINSLMPPRGETHEHHRPD